MKIIGRIKSTVYLHISCARIITTAKLDDESDLEYIPEYSSKYFIELVAYGETSFEQTEPKTQADKDIVSLLNNL